MIVKKKNIETFYQELNLLLPEIESLKVWNDCDIEGIGSIGAQILTDIGVQTFEWASYGKIDSIRKLMEFFEDSYKEFDVGANAYIYTDFHPTIMAAKDKISREQINLNELWLLPAKQQGYVWGRNRRRIR